MIFDLILIYISNRAIEIDYGILSNYLLSFAVDVVAFFLGVVAVLLFC